MSTTSAPIPVTGAMPAAVTRDVAVIAVSQTKAFKQYPEAEPTLIMDCVNDLLTKTGMQRGDLEFTIAGSCDYLSGMPFAFVMNIDGVGAWPPVYESHVEMDGAWAMWEAWLRLQLGDIDTALVIGSGKSSPGRPREVFALQADPYVLAPLGFDPDSLAGIQARALIDAGKATERDFAEIVSRHMRAGQANPYALISGAPEVDDLLAAPYFLAPLREHDLPAVADGAAALIMVAGDKARELTEHPVWIRGMDHRIESHHPGLRDLTVSPSTALAAQAVGLHDGPIDVAELMTLHSHEELILKEALGLGPDTVVNPSGGPLTSHPVMATGLVRVIEVAKRIAAGEARRGVAHATSGAALQQNLLCVLEGDN